MGLSQETDLQRHRVLLELAQRDRRDVQATLRVATEVAAAVLDVSRSSIWQLREDEGSLTCEDLFLQQERCHQRGERLPASVLPHFLQALREERTVTVHAVRSDPRTAELVETPLVPPGVTSLLAVPIWRRGRMYGALCVAHEGPARQWSVPAVDFAENLADVLALALEKVDAVEVERRWEAVIHSMAESVMVFDAQLNVVMMNPAAQVSFERAGGGLAFAEREALLEYRDLAGHRVPPERWPGPRLLAGERVRAEVMELYYRRTGERRFYEVTGTALWEGKRITGVVIVFADVTKDLHFERLRQDFLTEFAHELKTPVTITKTNAQLVARSALLPEQLRPRFEAIQRAAMRLDRLTDDLSEVSSILLEDLTLHPERVELGELARSVLERTTPEEQQHRLQVSAPGPVFVSADRAHLSRALRHLVDNALRYSRGPVEVRVRRQEEWGELSVRDYGIGIPADKQPHVFELFYRAHVGTPHDVGGLGLGLFLCREVVRSHGGTVWLESEEGRGSTFHTWLPLAPLDS